MPVGNTLPAVLAGAAAKSGELELVNRRTRARAPEAAEAGAFDPWSHTWDALGDEGWLPESRADRREAVSRAVEDEDWAGASVEDVGTSVEGQLPGAARQLELLLELDEPREDEGEVDPEGFLGNMAATFEILTSLEQIITTPFALVPFPAFPALRVMDMDFGFPHGHAHPPNTPPTPPAPFPSTGPVIPIPFLSGATRTLINGMPAARCGDVGLAIWCGGYFPMYEVFLGSSSVWIEGQRAGRMLVDVTHHCIFSDLKGPKGQDPPVGVPIGTTVTASANVLIGGVPLPSLTDFAVGKLAEHLFAGFARVAKRLKEGGERALERLAMRSGDELAEASSTAGGRVADDVADTLVDEAVPEHVPDTVPTRADELHDTVPTPAVDGTTGPMRPVDETTRFLDELERSGAVEIKGHERFREAARNDLDTLARTDTGRELLEQVKANHAENGAGVRIEPMRVADHPANGGGGPHCAFDDIAAAERTPDGARSGGSGSVIRYQAGEVEEGWGASYNPDTGRFEGGEPATSDTVLLHEMVHARNAGAGDGADHYFDTLDQTWKPRPSDDYRFPDPEEAEAVRLENRYRAEKGYGHRPDYYSSGEVSGETRELPAVGEAFADSEAATGAHPAVEGSPPATPDPESGGGSS